jgi:hypothetical protein
MRWTEAGFTLASSRSVAALSVGEGVARGLVWMASAARWWWAGWLMAARRLGGDPETLVKQR